MWTYIRRCILTPLSQTTTKNEKEDEHLMKTMEGEGEKKGEEEEEEEGGKMREEGGLGSEVIPELQALRAAVAQSLQDEQEDLGKVSIN